MHLNVFMSYDFTNTKLTWEINIKYIKPLERYALNANSLSFYIQTINNNKSICQIKSSFIGIKILSTPFDSFKISSVR